MTRILRVAVLIETTRAFGRGLIEGIAAYSRAHGPWSMYFEPQGLGVAPPAWLHNWDGDGILVRVDDQRMVDAVLQTQCPALDLRGRLESPLPFIGSNNELITKLVFDHLRERGLREFGFVGVAPGQIRALDIRREEFIKHVSAAQTQCHVFDPLNSLTTMAPVETSNLISVNNPLSIDWESEQEMLAQWLKSLPKPIGIMACHDPRGYQVVDACRRAGLKVPDEVAVVGVDNDQVLCQMADPPLTSVDPDGMRIGFTAASWLDRMMRGETGPDGPVWLEPKGLVARRSSDMFAIADAQIAQALRFIRDRACEGILVTDIVRELATSRSVLERKFRKLVGRTLKEELLRVQLDHARHLLADTDMALAEIARRTGFASDKYFSDAFWRQTQERPTVYRQRFRAR